MIIKAFYYTNLKHKASKKKRRMLESAVFKVYKKTNLFYNLFIPVANDDALFKKVEPKAAYKHAFSHIA